MNELPTLNLAKQMKKMAESMSNCMQKAIAEDPEGAKSWTPHQLFEKGALYAGKHVLITENKDE